jgi:hypothetical protein
VKAALCCGNETWTGEERRVSNKVSATQSPSLTEGWNNTQRRNKIIMTRANGGRGGSSVTMWEVMLPEYLLWKTYLHHPAGKGDIGRLRRIQKKFF